MILQFGPDAPLLLRAAAGSALVLHIAGGATGIAAGWTAILARKGERLHRVAGTVFFIGMLAMTVIGGIVAPMLPEGRWTNTTAAVFTFYLVVTAWATVRRGEDRVGGFERVAVLIPLGIAAMGLTLALSGADPAGFGTVYALAGLSALAAWCDLRMIRAGGVAGAPRVARHLWRMSAGLFVATGSFFVGQPKYVPAILKDTGLNVAPMLGVLALLVFWMIRVRFPPRRRPAALAPAE